MVDTLRNPKRLQQYLDAGLPNLVVYDEAHHSIAPTNKAILSAIDKATQAKYGRDAYKVGLTATVERGDGQELGSMWTAAYFYPLHEAIENRFLVHPVTIMERLPSLDLDHVAKDGADFDEKELAKELLLKGVVAHTVKVLGKYGQGRKPMVYCATVEQARKTADGLDKAGWKSSCIFGTTPEEEREAIITRFENAHPSEKHVLLNVMVLTEGTDIPCADLILMARPTKSKSLYLQVIGRGLRSFSVGNKVDCIVIDIAGISELHDLITAPVLLKTLKVEETAKKKATNGNVNPSDLSGMTRRKTRTKVCWSELDRLDRKVFCVDCGKEHGNVFLVQDKHVSTLWQPVWVHKEEGKRLIINLSKRPVDLSLAIGLGEDVARRASRLTIQEERNGWDEKDAIPAQYDQLFRFYGNEHVPMGLTRGQAAEMLTKKIGRWVCVEAGLANKVKK